MVHVGPMLKNCRALDAMAVLLVPLGNFELNRFVICTVAMRKFAQIKPGAAEAVSTLAAKAAHATRWQRIERKGSPERWKLLKALAHAAYSGMLGTR